jgi:hypothetical protein
LFSIVFATHALPQWFRNIELALWASAGASSAGEAIEDDDDDDDDDDDVLLSDSESGVSELSVASESVICIWSEV